MGILDHSKTWHFTVRAGAGECLRAFEGAMTRRPGLKLRAVKWKVRPETVISPSDGDPRQARIAVYEGRAGMAGFATAMSGARVQNVADVAVGSEMAFVVESESAGSTRCALYMRSVGTSWGLTGDAGYFRSYMKDVENALRQVDPSLQLSKS